MAKSPVRAKLRVMQAWSGLREKLCPAMRYDPFDELRREAIDLTPPPEVAENAARGLELRQRFGRGGTEVGVGVAASLGRREPQSPEMIRRMASYFARHEVDKRARNFGNEANPSAGHIAWLLWGGDAGRDWALEVKAQLATA